MWGLLERTVAVECLATVAGELKKSKADLQGLLPASEYSSLETFFSRTVEAAGACTAHVWKPQNTWLCVQLVQAFGDEVSYTAQALALDHQPAWQDSPRSASTCVLAAMPANVLTWFSRRASG